MLFSNHNYMQRNYVFTFLIRQRNYFVPKSDFPWLMEQDTRRTL